MFNRLMSIARGAKGVFPRASSSPAKLVWSGATGLSVGVVGIVIRNTHYEGKNKASKDEDEANSFPGTTIYTSAGMVFLDLNQYRFSIAAIAKDKDHNVICGAVALLKNNFSLEEMAVQEILKEIVDAKKKFEESRSPSDGGQLIVAIKKFQTALKDLKSDEACGEAIKSLREGAGVSHDLIKKLKSRISDRYRNTKYCVDIIEAELYAIKLAVDLAAMKMPKTPPMSDTVKIHNDNHNAIHRANFALLQAKNMKNFALLEDKNMKKIKDASLAPRKGHANEEWLVGAITNALDKTSLKIIFELGREENAMSDLLVWYAKTLDDDNVHYFGCEDDVAAIHISFKERIRLDKLKAKSKLSSEEQYEVEVLEELFNSLSNLPNKFE